MDNLLDLLHLFTDHGFDYALHNIGGECKFVACDHKWDPDKFDSHNESLMSISVGNSEISSIMSSGQIRIISGGVLHAPLRNPDWQVSMLTTRMHEFRDILPWLNKESKIEIETVIHYLELAVAGVKKERESGASDKRIKRENEKIYRDTLASNARRDKESQSENVIEAKQ